MLAIRRRTATLDRFRVVQGTLLLLVAPFLLFPDASVPAAVGAATALALAWLVPLWGRYRAYLPVTPQNLPLLLLGVMVFVAILVSADPEETVPKAFGLILGLGAWLYVAGAKLQGRAADGWLAFYTLTGLAFLSVGALTARWFVKYAALEPLVALLSPAGLSSLRTGTHPNQIAGTILLFLPLLGAYLLMEGRLRGWPRVALSVVTLGVLALLLLSQSRSAWLGAAGGLGFVGMIWLAARARASHGMTLTAVALLVVAFAGAAWLIANTELPVIGLGSTATTTDPLSSLTIRQEVWAAAGSALADFPLTGTGLGAFRAVVFRYYPLAVSPNIDIAHAHNIFIQTALDVGWPGLVGYVALLMSALATGWRALAAGGNQRVPAAGLMGSLIAFHLFGLTDALALGAKPALLLWLAFGLLAAFSNSPAQAGARQEPRDRS